MQYGEFISSFLIDLQRLFRLDISNVGSNSVGAISTSDKVISSLFRPVNWLEP